jgi:hypothetical protein
MQNNKITSLIMFVGGLVLVGLLFYFLSMQTRKTTTPTPAPQGEEIQEEEAKGAVEITSRIISDESGKEAIEIALQPKDTNPVLLSAIGVRGYVTGGDFANESALTVTKNDNLSESNWQYQITNAEVQENGLLIEISANHRGDELFTLDSKVILATIPLSQDYQPSSLTLGLDTDSTIFAGEDVEVLYPYQSK